MTTKQLTGGASPFIYWLMILGKKRLFAYENSWLRPLLMLVVAGVVLVNLLAWFAGEQIFLAEAREMDRARAVLQAERIANLLNKEALNLKRIILGRADRLLADVNSPRAGLEAVDFAQTVTEAFLAGANIDSYLVVNASRQPLFAVRFRDAAGVLDSLRDVEVERLVSLLTFADSENGGLTGIDVSPAGKVVLVAAVPIGTQQRHGWIVASRDLDTEQLARYGELLEKSFALRPVDSSVAAPDSDPAAVKIDASQASARWWMADLAGRPTLELTMAFDRSYEEHMGKTVALSRGGLLLLSVVAGASAMLLLWRLWLGQQREEESRREMERVARLAAIGELAAGVAHEVNNPNGMIRRNLDFVRDVLDDALPLLAEREDADRLPLGGVDLAMAREQLPLLLDDMTRGSRRIADIVRDLKDFAREDAPDNVVEFDLNEAVVAAVRLLDGTIRKATDHFALDLSPVLPKIRGNLGQVEQVIVNLIQNACHALPDRGSAIAVTTRYDAIRHCNLVEVADEGVGMPAEARDRIFEPFFTTRREVGGTGLGLSVSLRIVRRHGGTIAVATSPGNGTVMTISLPTVEVKA